MKKVLLTGFMIPVLASGFVACSEESTPTISEICDHFQKQNGDAAQIIEFHDTFERSQEVQDKAVDLCIEELTNLPACKDEILDLLICEYNHDASSGACYDEDVVETECWNDEKNAVVMDYVYKYDSKYYDLSHAQ